MVRFLLEGSLAELLRQVVPLIGGLIIRFEQKEEFSDSLVIIHQLRSFVQQFIDAVGRCGTGETKSCWDNIGGTFEHIIHLKWS